MIITCTYLCYVYNSVTAYARCVLLFGYKAFMGIRISDRKSHVGGGVLKNVHSNKFDSIAILMLPAWNGGNFAKSGNYYQLPDLVAPISAIFWMAMHLYIGLYIR